MTFEQLYNKWKRNVNAEYICPTLELFEENNYIINKALSKKEKLQILKRITNQVKESVND